MPSSSVAVKCGLVGDHTRSLGVSTVPQQSRALDGICSGIEAECLAEAAVAIGRMSRVSE